MNPNIAIRAENISKQYRLGEVGTGTITHDLNRAWAKLRGKEDPFLKIGERNDRSSKGESDYVWSLKDINFEIEKGDAVGIIGRNGAGKSTLLKLLSRVTKPTTGHFEVQGRIASLLEVGTGFNPEMTGRENIFLNGAILGMRRQEIKRKFDEIVDFAGVERYIDTPVKRYSSGMYVRLAFAVAAHLESEILIVDEVLAVGDAEFQKKCLGKMGDVSKGEGRTVLFVSHNIAAVKSLCNKGILLDRGNIVAIGQINDVAENYRISGSDATSKYSAVKGKDIFVKSADFLGNNVEFYSDEDINFIFNISNSISNLENVYFLVRIMNSDEQPLFSSQYKLENFSLQLKMTIAKDFLVKGFYHLSLFIYKPGSAPYDVVDKCCDFTILNNNSEYAHLETFNIGVVYNSNISWIQENKISFKRNF